MRIRSLLGLTVLCMLLSATAIANDGQVQRGASLAHKICWACHVVGTDQEFSPILREPAPDFRVIARRQDSSPEKLRNFLHTTHGMASDTPYKMPNPRLTDEMIDDVVNYILSLRKN
jgi:cytochrome c1